MTVKTRTFASIARLIKHYRNLTGKSQVVVAREIGFKNGQFISNVERGFCSIPIEKISGLSKAIEVPSKKIVDAMVSDYKMSLYENLRQQEEK